MKRTIFLLWLFLLAGAALAQGLEILPLRHRAAEEVLPQLQPLLEAGGVLTGTGDRLFVRASARNQADIRRALEQIDRPLRRLMITVRHDGAAAGEKVGAGGTVVLAPGDSSVRLRAGARSHSSRENVAQQVQTVEGGRAFINVGQSIAVPFRQTVLTPAGVVVSEGLVWHDIGTGFHAAPRVVGDRVMLDISPRHDTPGSVPGSANVQRLSTTVSGRLGEWIALGGATRAAAGEAGGTLHYSTRAARDDRQVWLRVEELP